MKKVWSVLWKLSLLFLFLTQTTFKQGFFALLQTNTSLTIMETLLQPSKQTQTIPLSFLVTSTSYDLAMYEQSLQRHEEYSEYEDITVKEPSIPSIPTQGAYKSILIYNTHQMEEYADQGSVVSGALYLQQQLEAKGVEVDVIEDDFVKYGRERDMGYKQLYSVSRVFLKEAMAQREYDLIIDFHRDALPRESTYVTYEGKKYAKLMVSIGINHEKYQENYQTASSIIDKMSKQPIPIMKSTYTIRSTYNQDLGSHVILLEVGSNTNYYEEVLNTLDVFVEMMTK
ncbi:MAG: stage II sporulation protein P [Erysipelotrichales bacterium]|nr:stage II sporulation protein P [Erysipelotrichales bacterium]